MPVMLIMSILLNVMDLFFFVARPEHVKYSREYYIYMYSTMYSGTDLLSYLSFLSCKWWVWLPPRC